MSYYPISVDLTGKTVLVVGGGEVALRKVERLLDYDARLIVVAPQVVSEITSLAEAGKIELRHRDYCWDDLFGPADTVSPTVLVIAATDNSEINKQVADDARGLNILVNVVDVPDLCSFIVPATVKRGDVTISVNTAGKSPALAKMIRKKCEEVFGEYYGELNDLLGEVRELAKSRINSQPAREKLYKDILESDIPELLKNGQRQQARTLAQRMLEGQEHGR